MKSKSSKIDEEIKLTNLAIIFFLGLLIIFGIYFTFYDQERLVERSIEKIGRLVERSIEKIGLFVRSIPRFVKGLIAKPPLSEFKLEGFEFKSCTDCTLIAQFENEDYLKIEYYIPHSKGEFSIFLHKIIERIFGVPVDYGWVSITSDIPNADWSNYNSINLFVKGVGESSRLEFAVIEEDGDFWYFFDEDALKSKNWIVVNMPFEEFIQPSWAPSGDGKKELHSIEGFSLTITSFDKEVSNTLYFAREDGSLVYLI